MVRSSQTDRHDMVYLHVGMDDAARLADFSGTDFSYGSGRDFPRRPDVHGSGSAVLAHLIGVLFYPSPNRHVGFGWEKLTVSNGVLPLPLNVCWIGGGSLLVVLGVLLFGVPSLRPTFSVDPVFVAQFLLVFLAPLSLIALVSLWIGGSPRLRPDASGYLALLSLFVGKLSHINNLRGRDRHSNYEVLVV